MIPVEGNCMCTTTLVVNANHTLDLDNLPFCQDYFASVYIGCFISLCFALNTTTIVNACSVFTRAGVTLLCLPAYLFVLLCRLNCLHDPSEDTWAHHTTDTSNINLHCCYWFLWDRPIPSHHIPCAKQYTLMIIFSMKYLQIGSSCTSKCKFRIAISLIHYMNYPFLTSCCRSVVSHFFKENLGHNHCFGTSNI
jgi:hypothetical protein